jgi:hypothetical protein
MSRTGPRPHCWKVQGEVPHQQHLAWLQMRAQANYRREVFELSLEDFQELWQGRWELKGRGADDYCLTRIDAGLPWNRDNVQCVPRADHFTRRRVQSTEKQNGNPSNKIST